MLSLHSDRVRVAGDEMGRMASRPRRIGVLANTYQERVGVLAGGHIHLIEVIRCWQDVEVTIFAPESAREGFCRALPDVRFVSMPSYGYLPWQIDQLSRAPAGVFKRDELREMDALLATSMLPGDIVPALLAMPDRTVVIIHHLFPSPWANGSIRPAGARELGGTGGLPAADQDVRSQRRLRLAVHHARVRAGVEREACFFEHERR